MSILDITCVDYQNSKKPCQISGKPDTCPICGKGIEPILCYAFMRGFVTDLNLEVVYKCPRGQCDHLFVAYYYRSGGITSYHFVLSKTRLPLNIEHKEFSETIKNISKNFPEIYNQAMLAEANGLDQICGGGYRKALEFLIKDYLISINPSEKERIQRLWLGEAIKEIDNKNIQICAERAAWLGNDELHYLRVWVDKDIEHLKDLIDLTVGWIEAEGKTKKYEKEMKKK